MKKLPATERARILHLLCEGSSIRAVTRLTSASKNTVIKLMIDAGKACAAYHDEHVRDLASRRTQVAASDDVGRAFRLKSATCSDRSRQAILIDVGRVAGGLGARPAPRSSYRACRLPPDLSRRLRFRVC